MLKIFTIFFLLLFFCNSYSQIKEKIKAGIYYIKQTGIKLKQRKSDNFYYIDKHPICTFNQNTKIKIDIDQFGQFVLSFQLDTLGTKRFFEATKKYLHKKLGVVVDGELISCPTVMQPISEGKATISGFTKQELEEIKTKIDNETKR